MTEKKENGANLDRRGFILAASAGLTAAGLMLTPHEMANAQEANQAAIAAEMQKNNLNRIASNTYGVRNLFRTRAFAGGGRGAAAGAGGAAGAAGAGGAGAAGGRGAAQAAARAADDAAMAQNPNAAEALAVSAAATAAKAKLPTPAEQRAKHGAITLMDFPQFTKDNFPGVTHMDLYSAFFGDPDDDSMFFPQGTAGGPRGFDPLAPSSKKYLDQLAAKCVSTGTYTQHISNNAPSNLAAYGSPEQDALRHAGVDMAKRWIEGLSVLGVKSMRMNSPQALGPSIRPNAVPRGPGDGYPRNIDIVPLLAAAIESYKEMADFGGKYGMRVTLENHWGLAADPMNIRTIIDEVNHPYCEASPDFGNWEQPYMLVNGLMALAPYAHTNVHAKYWDRWGDRNNVQRSTRIMIANGFRGTFALEYEEGPWTQMDGVQYLFKEVMTALSTPTPVV
jgi:sugar phosphate isomerase/epimerase